MKTEIVFNFDTTGSMYPCLMEVRRKLEHVATTLFKELPNLRIGFGANGDYCDAGRPYITAHTDLTNDLHQLTKFVRNVQSTGGGGNGGEAYELAMEETKTKYSWSDDAQKILVMIGDEVAHTPEYTQRYYNRRLDWRQIARELADQHRISIYTVQCLDQYRQKAHLYYPELAQLGRGYYLRLDQFSDIVELIMAITYRQVGVERVEQYEQEVAQRRVITRSLDRNFAVLTGRATSRVADVEPGLVPVTPGRFQVLRVPENSVIKDFVQKNHLIFKTGRGFYEFTKREEIQENKEVVLRDRLTGDMFSGDEARRIIGLPKGVRGKLSPTQMDKYQVFIQSTSYNRKLIGNTDFLYEVDHDA